ncbi:hypothetical protein LI90_2794 [Carbonactinospora thermoautotrophica]|uniref:Hemerythrin-like domain-containing protein n=2 Tax=Carbonactinospora thermoautotrophica TaxID=1469144 RepID=A0A132MWN2_9ACTN|nr:hemerythrin domain-containing protein [Carbonactinospora thermoautotrophica]KWX01762.1 hypothetical protein LI90_2794 [Carbonactinospora thermoautotrophica]
MEEKNRMARAREQQETRQEDVVDLLLRQHERIRLLFAEVLDAEGEQRGESFQRLVRLLAVHETAEEMVVHPQARPSFAGGESVVDALLLEEREAKEVLSELDRMGPDAPDFERKLIKLRDMVLAHAAHEAQYEFPGLRQGHDPGRLRLMAQAVRAAEAMAPGVEADIAVGSLASLIDHTRDVVQNVMEGRSPS